MLSVPVQAGVERVLYDIGTNMQPVVETSPENSDWLLFVNYFGLHGGASRDVVSRFGRDRVVVDNAQAFFVPPGDELATLYSPRKFFGLPDGGLLVTRVALAPPHTKDSGSLARTTHLLERPTYGAEAGYAAYQEAERSLCNLEPMRMSSLTSILLRYTDSRRSRLRRTRNFSVLHRLLGPTNEFKWDYAQADGPLCYPYLAQRSGLRAALARERVFVPTYWPEVADRCVAGTWERELLDRCLALPCDQRYEADEMARVAELVQGLESEAS